VSTLLELSDEMRRLGYLLMDLEEAGGRTRRPSCRRR